MNYEQKIEEYQSQIRSMNQQERQEIIEKYGSYYDWAATKVAADYEKKSKEEEKERKRIIEKHKNRLNVPKKIHFCSSNKEKIESRFKKYFAEGNIIDSCGLKFQVTKIDWDRWDIYAEVLESDWHCFNVGEKLIWEHNYDDIWCAEYDDPFQFSENRVMYLYEEGPAFGK